MCKRRKSWPVSRVLSRTAIHLGDKSPCRSSNLPRSRAGHAYAPLFDLAPGGVFPATPVTSRAVRSYRTISPLPGSEEPGGIFSAALSVGSRLPGITWHPALWSPDFPPFYFHKTATARPTLKSIIQKFSTCLDCFVFILTIRCKNARRIRRSDFSQQHTSGF